MDKIYTRHKLRLPIIKKNKLKNTSKKTKVAIKSTITIFIIIIVMLIIIKSIHPVFQDLCEDKAKSIATIVSNEQATEVMKKYSYNNLYEIEKDNDGNITMIKSNIFAINEITSDIAVKIQNEINKRGRDNIEIALGTFTGSKLLSGRGPGIKISISTIGNIETNLKSEFYSKGINQTLHRVYLQVECKIIVLTPFKDINSEITNQVLLAENVIVGNIPDTFYNFEGVNQEDAGLETIQ